MSGRSLLASINGRPVGTLAEENGVWSFQYDEPWLEAADRFALSPPLPLQVDKISTDRRSVPCNGSLIICCRRRAAAAPIQERKDP